MFFPALNVNFRLLYTSSIRGFGLTLIIVVPFILYARAELTLPIAIKSILLVFDPYPFV